MTGIQFRTVSRKRLATWVIILAVGMTMRIAVAAPGAAVAALRAAICCAERCPEERSPMPPERCCMVESAATDPASTVGMPSLERPALVALALALPGSALALAPRATVATEHPRLGAGPPGHPETQKLRC
jgi:hypothetical protein